MLTVFIATRNGSRTLPMVLDALTRIEQPASGWKLVIADNGSTDNSREIIESYRERLPLTYIYEDRMGKNVALNTALNLLEGDLAVFSDDDVLPHPEWLVRLRAAADAQPEYTMFGGRIVAHWEIPPPHWVEWINQAAVFALSHPDLADGPMDPGYIFGPSMVVRAEHFYGGLRFDESIGPCGSNYAMGSESQLLWRLQQQGYLAWFVKDAVVAHFIRAHQMDPDWVVNRAVRLGRGQLRMLMVQAPETISPWLRMPAIVPFKLVVRAIRVFLYRLLQKERHHLIARWEYNLYLGYLVEAHHLRRSGLNQLPSQIA